MEFAKIAIHHVLTVKMINLAPHARMVHSYQKENALSLALMVNSVIHQLIPAVVAILHAHFAKVHQQQNVKDVMKDSYSTLANVLQDVQMENIWLKENVYIAQLVARNAMIQILAQVVL